MKLIKKVTIIAFILISILAILLSIMLFHNRGFAIPINAKPTFHLEAYGLAWDWKQKLKQGCIHYRARSSDYIYIKLEANGCNSEGLLLQNYYHSDEIVFARDRRDIYELILDDWSGGKPCPFIVTDDEIAILQEQVSEAKRLAQFPIEHTALSQLEKGLITVDGHNLLTNAVRGCDNSKLSDYKKPTS